MNMGELTLLPICHVTAWVEKSCPLPTAIAEAGGRAGLEIRKAKELVLPLISYSTCESGLCTILGQHDRAGPEGIVVRDLTLGT